MSATGERLARLLFIVPYVAHRDGVPVRELADKLGIKPSQVEADLALLSMVGQPPLTPDHLIDLYVEDNVVYVDLDQSLSRPLRLTRTEARALVLAARLAGGLGGIGDELNAVVDRILELLGPQEANQARDLSQRIGVWRGAAATSEPVTVLRQAVESREEVEVDYYSASSDRQKEYVLRPLALISHTGVEYLVALDVDAELREKLFRLDRLAAATLTGRPFEAPPTLDLERFKKKKLFFGEESVTAWVRFAPSVAGAVRERFAGQHAKEMPDGGVELQLATSNLAWLARWVLPFGTDAEVVSPDKLRQDLASLCQIAAEAYGKAPPTDPKE